MPWYKEKTYHHCCHQNTRKPLKTVQQKPAGIRHKNTAVVCKEKFDREQEHTDSKKHSSNNISGGISRMNPPP